MLRADPLWLKKIGRKKDASVQLPTSHVLPYATVEGTAMKTTLITAFESSSRLCVICCNFISVHVMNLLRPVWTIDCDFWIGSIQIFRRFHWNTYSPFHAATTRLQSYSAHNQNIIIKSAFSLDLPLRFWTSIRFVVTICSTRSANFVFFCKEYKLKCMQLNFVLGSFENDI